MTLANAAPGEGGEIIPSIRFHTEGAYQREQTAVETTVAG